jgi:Flp pilus assembly pilin Flp
MISKVKGLYCKTVCLLTGGDGDILIEYSLLSLLMARHVITRLKGFGIKTNNTFPRINPAMASMFKKGTISWHLI